MVIKDSNPLEPIKKIKNDVIITIIQVVSNFLNLLVMMNYIQTRFEILTVYIWSIQ
ncbi:protein of unknown function [Candidatus Nitrosocosmicus franklandus]|uniref:Uncharacterized protein n=1 Tax=Candidatus Nitrosocosmicus franklandianus TaxID=1798806 RepID=A0A484IAT6_9ARCH|nr:protein of unknown function [Candidatus Nitrosocosmicus franklandus]